jgi:MFS family permease
MKGRTRRPATPLLSRPLVLLLVATAASFAGFGLLLSVVPTYMAKIGAGDAGAGLSTGVLMFAAVVTEPVVPGLMRRGGHRALIVAGVVLLGTPTLVLADGPGLPLTLVVCALRGAGLAVIVVTATALVADISPPSRRNEGLGLYGLAIGIPPILTLPGGVWLAAHVGYAPVFVLGAALPLTGLFALAGLPAAGGQTETPKAGHNGGNDHNGGNGGLLLPAITFAAVTFAFGVVVTFLPLAVPPRSEGLVAAGLLAQSCTAPLARWATGPFGDRRGPGVLVPAAVLLTAVGMLGLFWKTNPVALIAGMAVFGLGFGTAQNVTLAVMLERVHTSRYGHVSAVWNIAYDGGMGLGAVGFGYVVGLVGYATGFGFTAAVLAAALVPALRCARRSRRARAQAE